MKDAGHSSESQDCGQEVLSQPMRVPQPGTGNHTRTHPGSLTCAFVCIHTHTRAHTFSRTFVQTYVHVHIQAVPCARRKDTVLARELAALPAPSCAQCPFPLAGPPLAWGFPEPGEGGAGILLSSQPQARTGQRAPATS